MSVPKEEKKWKLDQDVRTLAEAIEIAKEGVEKLTLKILADATGTSRSAIYKHFKNKEALIETIIERGFERFDAALAPAFSQQSKPFEESFFFAGKCYIEFARANPNLYRLLFGEKYAHIRSRLSSIKEDDGGGFAALKNALEAGQKAGIIKKGDSFEQAIVVWSMMHGFSLLLIDGFMDVEEIYEKVYDALFETLLKGLGT